MPEPKEEEQGEFKVVDRRLFTQDGERRADAAVEPPQSPPPSQEAARKAPPPPQAAPQRMPPASEPPKRQEQANSRPAQPSAAERPSDAPPRDQSAAHFEQLVMSLMTTAMFQMGLAARPGEQPPPPDFPAAQETIDLLTALQDKTKGNLSLAESDMLTGGLYELRMAFVELTRRLGRPIG
jgi:hypothetical protein